MLDGAPPDHNLPGTLSNLRYPDQIMHFSPRRDVSWRRGMVSFEATVASERNRQSKLISGA